jgi:hypothetical protein
MRLHLASLFKIFLFMWVCCIFLAMTMLSIDRIR